MMAGTDPSVHHEGCKGKKVVTCDEQGWKDKRHEGREGMRTVAIDCRGKSRNGGTCTTKDAKEKEGGHLQ